VEKRSPAKGIFIVALIAAVACIAIGGYNVWRSFERFDESILTEKDSQFYSLMRSDDINIENSINALEREAETFLGRRQLAFLIREWKDSGDTAGLRAYLADNSLDSNPIYADLVMYNGDKLLCTATGERSYSAVTGAGASGLHICTDDSGSYYMAYRQEGGDGISYDVLIDLARLYRMAVGIGNDHETMLIDAASTVAITSEAGEVAVDPVTAEENEKTTNFRDFLMSCQKEDISDGISVEIADEGGKPYTARMVAMPSGSTVNGEFAMGILANYEEAIAPSRAAAEEMLVFGGLAMAGVIGLLLLIIMMRRANEMNSAELRALKKKNETMEDINRKMQALAHHQRLETIGTMTASIAHDFNNLLTPIMGYSIMTMEMLPADATDLQENLLEIYDASMKAKDIVTRLAELTKKSKEEN